MLKKMESWPKFAKKVSRRSRWKNYITLLSGDVDKLGKSPLTWAATRAVLNGDTLGTIERWHRSVASQRKLKTTTAEVIDSIEQLTVGGAGQMRADAETALLAVAAAQTLPSIAAISDEGRWRDALDSLVDMSVSSRNDWELMPWGYQLVSVELPMTLAFLLPELDAMDQIGCEAAERLNESLAAMLDLDGWPAAEYLSVLAPLAASWTRCFKVARKAGFSSDHAADEQIHWLVPQIFRLMRNDGSLMLSDFQDSPVDEPFLSQLVTLMKGKKRRQFALVCRQRKPKRADVDAVELQESSLSEWAASGAYQSRWCRKSPKFAIDFSGKLCRVELGRNLPLIGGCAMPEVRLNEQRLDPIGDFEVVCDEQNDDIDFLELEIDLGGNVVLQRQMILSRDDEFLLLADAVKSSEVGSIDYRCKWPLAPGVSAMRESETREIYLTTGKIQSLILPLALPEWKAARFDGQLKLVGKSIVLHQRILGNTLYAPLFFDLSPKRSKRPRTWRQLTVAEHLNIVPNGVAVAFRVQLDSQQWILYRSLTENGNRTFMGENFAGEFFFGEFGADGTVTPLLQIE